MCTASELVAAMDREEIEPMVALPLPRCARPGRSHGQPAWGDPRYQNLLRACNQLGCAFLFHLASHEFDPYGIITEPGQGGLEGALQRCPSVQSMAHSPAGSPR